MYEMMRSDLFCFHFSLFNTALVNMIVLFAFSAMSYTKHGNKVECLWLIFPAPYNLARFAIIPYLGCLGEKPLLFPIHTHTT